MPPKKQPSAKTRQEPTPAASAAGEAAEQPEAAVGSAAARERRLATGRLDRRRVLGEALFAAMDVGAEEENLEEAAPTAMLPNPAAAVDAAATAKGQQQLAKVESRAAVLQTRAQEELAGSAALQRSLERTTRGIVARRLRGRGRGVRSTKVIPELDAPLGTSIFSNPYNRWKQVRVIDLFSRGVVRSIDRTAIAKIASGAEIARAELLRDVFETAKPELKEGLTAEDFSRVYELMVHPVLRIAHGIAVADDEERTALLKEPQVSMSVDFNTFVTLTNTSELLCDPELSGLVKFLLAQKNSLLNDLIETKGREVALRDPTLKFIDVSCFIIGSIYRLISVKEYKAAQELAETLEFIVSRLISRGFQLVNLGSAILRIDEEGGVKVTGKVSMQQVLAHQVEELKKVQGWLQLRSEHPLFEDAVKRLRDSHNDFFSSLEGVQELFRRLHINAPDAPPGRESLTVQRMKIVSAGGDLAAGAALATHARYVETTFNYECYFYQLVVRNKNPVAVGAAAARAANVDFSVLTDTKFVNPFMLQEARKAVEKDVVNIFKPMLLKLQQIVEAKMTRAEREEYLRLGSEGNNSAQFKMIAQRSKMYRCLIIAQNHIAADLCSFYSILCNYASVWGPIIQRLGSGGMNEALIRGLFAAGIMQKLNLLSGDLSRLMAKCEKMKAFWEKLSDEFTIQAASDPYVRDVPTTLYVMMNDGFLLMPEALDNLFEMTRKFYVETTRFHSTLNASVTAAGLEKSVEELVRDVSADNKMTQDALVARVALYGYDQARQLGIITELLSHVRQHGWLNYNEQVMFVWQSCRERGLHELPEPSAAIVAGAVEGNVEDLRRKLLAIAHLASSQQKGDWGKVSAILEGGSLEPNHFDQLAAAAETKSRLLTGLDEVRRIIAQPGTQIDPSWVDYVDRLSRAASASSGTLPMPSGRLLLTAGGTAMTIPAASRSLWQLDDGTDLSLAFAMWLRRFYDSLIEGDYAGYVATEPVYPHGFLAPGYARPDGNCLFAAIAAQVDGKNHGALRDMAVARMRSEPRFVEFVNAHHQDITLPSALGVFNPKNAAEYFTEMEKASVWGGALELQALAESLRRPIVLFTIGNMVWPQFFGEEQPGEPIFVFYDGAHYVPLLRKETAVNLREVYRKVRREWGLAGTARRRAHAVAATSGRVEAVPDLSAAAIATLITGKIDPNLLVEWYQKLLKGNTTIQQLFDKLCVALARQLGGEFAVCANAEELYATLAASDDPQHRRLTNVLQMLRIELAVINKNLLINGLRDLLGLNGASSNSEIRRALLMVVTPREAQAEANFANLLRAAQVNNEPITKQELLITLQMPTTARETTVAEIFAEIRKSTLPDEGERISVELYAAICRELELPEGAEPRDVREALRGLRLGAGFDSGSSGSGSGSVILDSNTSLSLRELKRILNAKGPTFAADDVITNIQGLREAGAVDDERPAVTGASVALPTEQELLRQRVAELEHRVKAGQMLAAGQAVRMAGFFAAPQSTIPEGSLFAMTAAREAEGVDGAQGADTTKQRFFALWHGVQHVLFLVLADSANFANILSTAKPENVDKAGERLVETPADWKDCVFPAAIGRLQSRGFSALKNSCRGKQKAQVLAISKQVADGTDQLSQDIKKEFGAAATAAYQSFVLLYYHLLFVSWLLRYVDNREVLPGMTAAEVRQQAFMIFNAAVKRYTTTVDVDRDLSAFNIMLELFLRIDLNDFVAICREHRETCAPQITAKLDELYPAAIAEEGTADDGSNVSSCSFRQ